MVRKLYTCSSLKAEVDLMVLQVQTRSQQHYAFTKVSRSTQNQRL
jgi:hypothetical protein